MIEKKFNLFASCIPQKGNRRGIIVDFKRKVFYIFPNEILDLIDEYNKLSLYNLFNDFKDDNGVLKKYIKYFIDNELVIISNEIERFEKISSIILKPFYIDVISLELDEVFIKSDFCEIADDNGVVCLKIIVKKKKFKLIPMFLELLAKSKIHNITLYIEFEKEFINDIIEIKNYEPRIDEIIFFNSNFNSDEYVDNSIFIEVNNISDIFFRNVNTVDNFVMEQTYYLESLSFNPMYNRSIHVNNLGNIHKYFSESKSYGNIFENNLYSIVGNSVFKDFWEISKDKIYICKDCEFRYICPDGRIPMKIKSSDTFYSHKSECNYNPYTNEWKNEK